MRSKTCFDIRVRRAYPAPGTVPRRFLARGTDGLTPGPGGHLRRRRWGRPHRQSGPLTFATGSHTMRLFLGVLPTELRTVTPAGPADPLGPPIKTRNGQQPGSADGTLRT